MQRWSGKVAVVTGASSGIGWACTKDLLSEGMLVVGLARRLKQMEELHAQLDAKLRENFFPRECDIGSLSSLKTAFLWIEQRLGKVHVLINNAGMAEMCKLLDNGNEASLKRVVDVNLMGTVYCTKEAYRLMQVSMAAGEECHVITVNSLLGHTVPPHIPACGFNLYPVAKHALRATQEILRRELHENKLIRLSSISPGLTKTEFATFQSKDESEVEEVPDCGELLHANDISRGILFILSSPPHVTIAELLMVPSGEAY